MYAFALEAIKYLVDQHKVSLEICLQRYDDSLSSPASPPGRCGQLLLFEGGASPLLAPSVLRLLSAAYILLMVRAREAASCPFGVSAPPPGGSFGTHPCSVHPPI